MSNYTTEWEKKQECSGGQVNWIKPIPGKTSTQTCRTPVHNWILCEFTQSTGFILFVYCSSNRSTDLQLWHTDNKKTTAEETWLPNLFAYSLQVFQCSHNQPLITADVYIDEISVPWSQSIVGLMNVCTHSPKTGNLRFYRHFLHSSIQITKKLHIYLEIAPNFTSFLNFDMFY